MRSIRALLPGNKVYVVHRKRAQCFDVCCYSNHWEGLLGWKVGKGPKVDQGVKVPAWIKENRRYTISCLRGLIETDGSIYRDRGYPMVEFKSAGAMLAYDFDDMVRSLGFRPHTYWIAQSVRGIFHVRLSKNVAEFLRLVRPRKS